MTSSTSASLDLAGAILPPVSEPTRLSAVLRVWDEALCAEVDAELFFPEKGEPSRAALKVCAACGVRALCRETFGPLVSYGVVGGTTAKQRYAAGRAARRGDEVAA